MGVDRYGGVQQCEGGTALGGKALLEAVSNLLLSLVFFVFYPMITVNSGAHTRVVLVLG